MRASRKLRIHWGKLVRQARYDAGLSQKECARLLGVPQEYVSRWENGIYAPRDDIRPYIAATLGKAVTELFPYVVPDDPNGDDQAAA